MIGGKAGPGQQQELRPELQRHDDADGGGVVMGELGEHQPILGRALHPGADVGDEGAGGPDPIVEFRSDRKTPQADAHGSLRLIAAVEAAEMPRQKQRRSEARQPERGDVACVLQIEIADAADQHIADDEIEKTPEHVDGR